jgi:hypothetical protein
MSSYLIDLGNSNDGPIGMVLRVNAADKAEAVEVARRAIKLVADACGQVSLRVPTEMKETVDYISVYLNPNVVTEQDVGDDDSEETISFPGPMDWTALARQKRWLLKHALDSQEAAGLVDLLDTIQDAAVDDAGMPEAIVFPNDE